MSKSFYTCINEKCSLNRQTLEYEDAPWLSRTTCPECNEYMMLESKKSVLALKVQGEYKDKIH